MKVRKRIIRRKSESDRLGVCDRGRERNKERERERKGKKERWIEEEMVIKHRKKAQKGDRKDER